MFGDMSSNIHSLFGKEKEQKSYNQKSYNKTPVYLWKQKDGSEIPVYAKYTTQGEDEHREPTCVLGIGGFQDLKLCFVDEKAKTVKEALNEDKYSYFVRQGEKAPEGYRLLKVFMTDKKSAEKKTKEEKRKEMENERISKYFGALKNGVTIEDSWNTSNIENKKKENIRMQEELKKWEGSNYISEGESGYKFKTNGNFNLFECLVTRYLKVKIDLTTTEQLLNKLGTKFETFVKKFAKEAITSKEEEIPYEELEKFFINIGFKDEFEKKVTYAKYSKNVNNTSTIYSPDHQPKSTYLENHDNDMINNIGSDYSDLSSITINDNSLPIYDTSSPGVDELLNNYNNINLPNNYNSNELYGFSPENDSVINQNDTNSLDSSYGDYLWLNNYNNNNFNYYGWLGSEPGSYYISDTNQAPCIQYDHEDKSCSFSSKQGNNSYYTQTYTPQQISNNVNYDTNLKYPYTYHEGRYYY